MPDKTPLEALVEAVGNLLGCGHNEPQLICGPCRAALSDALAAFEASEPSLYWCPIHKFGRWLKMGRCQWKAFYESEECGVELEPLYAGGRRKA